MQRQADGWQEPEVSLFGIDFGNGLGKGAGADAGDSGMEALRFGHHFGNGVIENDLSAQSPWLDPSLDFRYRKAGLGLAGDAPPELRHRVEELSAIGWNAAEALPSLLHDTRNMVAAMELYCDLLDEPGVLAAPFRHYAGELRLIGNASRRLLEKLAAPESVSERRYSPEPDRPREPETESFARRHPRFSTHPPFLPGSLPVASLAEDLLANQNLLSALAGPAVTVGLTLSGGHLPVAMSSDDLTRVLVNLTRNAAEAMPGGGHIQISVEEFPDSLLLTFADNGPGIPPSALKAIFCPGYSTHVNLDRDQEMDEGSLHRGLGLSIVHAIVSSAGGSVRAENRSANRLANCGHDRSNAEEESGGAAFLLQFPLKPPRTP